MKIDLNEKIAIHVPTEDLAIKVYEKALNMGLNCSGWDVSWDVSLVKRAYKTYTDRFCYSFYKYNNLNHGPLYLYEENKFRIISAEEFLKINKKPKDNIRKIYW